MNNNLNLYTKTIKVLIVEDDKSDALYFEEVLQNSELFDYEIFFTGSLSSFKSIIQNEKYDLVFCDINLSDSIGHKTLQELSHFNLNFPIVIISGEEDLRLYEKASHFGFTDFLNKNEISTTDFDKKIHYLLNKYENEQKLIRDKKLEEYQSRIDLVSSITGETAHQFNNMLGAMLGLVNNSTDGNLTEDNKLKLINYISLLGEMSDQLITLSQKQELSPELTSSCSLIKLFQDNSFNTNNISESRCTLNIDFNLLIKSLKSFFDNFYSSKRSEISISSSIQSSSELSLNNEVRSIAPGDYFHLKFESNEVFNFENLSSKQTFYFLVLKGIVEQHNGLISSESVGIDLYLPISSKTSVIDNNITPFKLTKKIQNILYAEDQQDIRETTTELLRLNNYNVVEFENGMLALNYYKNKFEEIDLIITDYAMPELNGSDLFNEVRVLNKNIPCIFTSGYSQSEITKSGSLPQGTRYLKKPCDFKTLISTINEIHTHK